MRVCTTLLILGLFATSAQAADIPARFHGVWINAAASDQRCASTDWSRRFDTMNEALVRITAQRLEEWEGECVVKSAKVQAVPSGMNRMTDGPTFLIFNCSSEGETRTARETWDLVQIRGNDALVVSTPGSSQLRTYVRCQ